MNDGLHAYKRHCIKSVWLPGAFWDSSPGMCGVDSTGLHRDHHGQRSQIDTVDDYWLRRPRSVSTDPCLFPFVITHAARVWAFSPDIVCFSARYFKDCCS